MGTGIFDIPSAQAKFAAGTTGIGETKYLSSWQDFDNIEGVSSPVWQAGLSDAVKSDIVMQSIVDCINFKQGDKILAELISGAPTFYTSNPAGYGGWNSTATSPQPSYGLNSYIRLTQLVPGFDGNRQIEFFKPAAGWAGPQDWTAFHSTIAGSSAIFGATNGVSYTVNNTTHTPTASPVVGNPVTSNTGLYGDEPRRHFYGGNLNAHVVITEHLTGSSGNGGN